MQAVILDFPERKPQMTQLPNARLQRVEEKVNLFDGRMDAIEHNSAAVLESITALRAVVDKPRSGPNPWIPIIITALSTLVTVLGLAYNWHKVDKLNTSINGEHGLTAREGKLETNLRLLAAAVAPQLLHEIDMSLSESAKAVQDGQVSAASVVLARVADQANVLRQTGIAADQTFFSNAASTLSTISSKEFQITDPAWTSLAAYHSAVIHPGNLATIFAPGSKEVITTEELANLPEKHGSSIKGFAVYIMDQPLQLPPGVKLFGDGVPVIVRNIGDGDWVRPIAGPRHGEVRSISNVIVVTPNQTLDEIVWNNVVFVNARIRYLGGAVMLKNVRFVNCTFDIQAKVGQPILNYAISQQPDLIIPGSTAVSPGL
jgi:hypothetical protein